jgi:hypothetical protein
VLINWLYGTGVSAHTSTGFLDIIQEYEDFHSLVEKQPSAHIGILDGHIVHVPAHGEVMLNLSNLTYMDGDLFTARTENVCSITHTKTLL